MHWWEVGLYAHGKYLLGMCELISTSARKSHSGCFSATGFLSFMNGYTVFLGPIAGIMVTDVRAYILSFHTMTHKVTVLDYSPDSRRRAVHVSPTRPISIQLRSSEYVGRITVDRHLTASLA